MNPEAPQPRPEKTEAEVAEQIGRIADKLGNRTRGMTEAINATNTPENNLTAYYDYPKQLSEIEHSKSPEQGGKTETKIEGRKGQFTTISKKTDNDFLLIKGTNGERRTEGRIMGEKGIDLSQEQTIHAAAGILSQTRGELARRKIEHDKIKQAQSETTSKKLDEILSA